MSKAWPLVPLGEVLSLVDTAVPTTQLGEINLAGVYSFGRGLFRRGSVSPGETSYKTYNRLVTDDYIISQPKAWEGAIARVTQISMGGFCLLFSQLSGLIVSGLIQHSLSGSANAKWFGQNCNKGRAELELDVSLFRRSSFSRSKFPSLRFLSNSASWRGSKS